MIAKIRAAGASDVIQHGANWKEADSYLRQVVLDADPNGVYVPPFDHPDIWTGNSSVITDAARQLDGERPDVIICSVGGGGLLNGVVEGMDRLGWSDVPVLAVETDGAQSLQKALQAGELITLPAITSQATSLGCTQVSAKTFEYAQRPTIKSVVLSDAEAAMGCWRLADDERLVVELACGVNVALMYDGRLKKVLGRQLTPDHKVLVVLCGGGNVTVDMLAEWKRQFGGIEKVVRRDSTVPSAVVHCMH
jgi:L-serine/L-threonine ammonia-lyase